MKSLFLIILIFYCSATYGQSNRNHMVYENVGFIVGNYYGGSLGLNYIYNEKYSAVIKYSAVTRSSKTVPSDYNIGLADIWTLGTMLPYDKIRSFEFLVGRVIKLNKNGKIRLNFKLGPSYSKITEPVNWEPRGSLFILVSNYSFEYESVNTVGIVVNPEFEFPFGKYVGLSASPFFNFYKQTTVYGVELKLMLGKLRRDYLKNPFVE